MTFKRRLRLLLIIAGLGGAMASCASLGVRGAPVDLPGLHEATQVAWDSYECLGPPPTVLVVQGAELTCVDPRSGKPGFPVKLSSGDACRSGYTLALDRVSVAYRGQPWSESSLAHEELHACQARMGVVEPAHHGFEGPDWGPGGRLDRANVLLRARGL